MKKSKIISIFQQLSKNYKNPKTELKYINNFTFLVSVILSAQSTDVSVNKATKNLFKIAGNPKQFLNLGKIQLTKYIKTIGLYNTKAKNILSLCKILINDYNNKVPHEFAKLIKLPGVGNKTASVYQNAILNKPRIAVDTHVFRVSNRIGLVKENDTNKTQFRLEKIIPLKWKYKAHQQLILHGRRICKARKPLCSVCCLRSLCSYKNKNLQTN